MPRWIPQLHITYYVIWIIICFPPLHFSIPGDYYNFNIIDTESNLSLKPRVFSPYHSDTMLKRRETPAFPGVSAIHDFQQFIFFPIYNGAFFL